jgi:hypothetical protein
LIIRHVVCHEDYRLLVRIKLKVGLERLDGHGNVTRLVEPKDVEK